MAVAEGKNIHFSPVDNKPLCSYSSKLCRQRRLNGYGFCIRHILEDKSAPFKQCDYVTRNNSQQCLNAIPTNQERGYCHSHMQVAGIIPKTERKVKPAAPKLPSISEKASSTAPDADELSVQASSQKQPKAPAKKKSEKSKSSSSSSVSAEASLTSTSIESITDGSEHPIANRILPDISCPPGDTSKKKSKGSGKKAAESKPMSEKPPKQPRKIKIPKTEPPSPKWKTEKFVSGCTAFEQLKTLKILEKLPLRTDTTAPKSLDAAAELNLLPPFLRQKSISSESISSSTAESCDHLTPRQAYLNSVRSSFKSQYKALRRVIKMNEKSEVKNEPLRESLLTCVVIDPSRCAHILVNGEDELELDTKGKKGQKAPNGLLNGKRKEKKTESSTSCVDKAKPSKPKKSTKKSDKTNLNTDVEQLQKQGVEIKVEHEAGEIFVGPWMNGFWDEGQGTKTPVQRKSNSKAKSSVKTEGIVKSEDKKSHAPRKPRNGAINQSASITGSSPASTSNIVVPAPARKSKKASQSRKSAAATLKLQKQQHSSTASTYSIPPLMNSAFTDPSITAAKKRRIEESASTIISTNGQTSSHHNHHHRVLDPNITLNATAAFHTPYSPSDLSAVQAESNVLNSVSSSDTVTTPDGVITDASFDSPFDHSTSSHPDCDFADDDDLEKSFELHIDAEIQHQASRLIEENGLTEDDFSELFPENRLSDHKLGSDFSFDLAPSNFESPDIDYTIFNMYPNYRPPGSSESISVTQNF